MGRLWDFVKRRIVGYLVFWIVVLFVVGLYKGDQPAQAGIFILAFAFTMSYAYTSRMKRRQREWRELAKRAPP